MLRSDEPLEQRLRRAQRRLELVVSSMNAGLWLYRDDDHSVIWDQRLRRIYGLDEEDGSVPILLWEDRLHPDDREYAVRATERAKTDKTDYALRFRILRADGEVRTLQSWVSVQTEDDGVTVFVGVNFDITEEVRAAEALRQAKELAEQRAKELEAARAEMEHIALHDALTGMPNRRFLETQQRSQDLKTTNRSAILLMDLDRFKQINDALGHDAGDHVLRHIAGLLTQCGEGGRFAARVGGDEFAVYLAVAPDTAGLEAMARDLITRISTPVDYFGRECRVGVSIGIAVSGQGDDAGRRLFLDADIALYRAKAEGRGGFVFYSAPMRRAAELRKRKSDEVMDAVERRQLVCHYQPQFHARTGVLSGLEALVRWPRSDGSMTAPTEFLPIAQDLGILGRIDRLVLETVLTDLATWGRQKLFVPRVSLNLSGARLEEEGFAQELAGMDKGDAHISFELLESTFLDEISPVVSRNLNAIRSLGFGLEIDDFGTGHASVLSLLRLKPDRLKIDRRLVEHVETSSNEEQVLKAIIEVGHLLGLVIVAEGIETAGMARRLTELGCDHLQGFYLARPMAKEDLVRVLSQPDEVRQI